MFPLRVRYHSMACTHTYSVSHTCCFHGQLATVYVPSCVHANCNILPAIPMAIECIYSIVPLTPFHIHHLPPSPWTLDQSSVPPESPDLALLGSTEVAQKKLSDQFGLHSSIPWWKICIVHYWTVAQSWKSGVQLLLPVQLLSSYRLYDTSRYQNWKPR